MSISLSYPPHALSRPFALCAGTGKCSCSWLWARIPFVLLFGVSTWFFTKLETLYMLCCCCVSLSKGFIIDLHLLIWSLHTQTTYSKLKAVWQVNTWCSHGAPPGVVLSFLVFVWLRHIAQVFSPQLNAQICNAPWNYSFLTLIRRASARLGPEENLYTRSLVSRPGKCETCVYPKGCVL